MEKLAIVEEAKTSGDPIALLARRHGMNANHLFNWMQRERDGMLDRRALYGAPGGPMEFPDLGSVGGSDGSLGLRGHDTCSLNPVSAGLTPIAETGLLVTGLVDGVDGLLRSSP